MAAIQRKPISLKKKGQGPGDLWHDEPDRFTDAHIDPLLMWCVQQGASDITIQTDRPVYNEIHGKLYPAVYRPLDSGDVAIFLHRLYGNEAQARLAAGKDLDVSYEVRPDRYSRTRFRVNITAIQANGRDSAQITMRVLPSEPPKLADLNIEPDIISGIAPRQGMVIVTGPTGSGKTTLLAAINRELLERSGGCGKMLTYEAPIEYTYDTIKSPHSVVAQTEIGRHLPSFASGVRNALRRKPNIIMIGEARDRETISAAIEAGQTGHAVYTTTHTVGVAATIRRMVSSFEPEERRERAYALMETVRLIITQALVPRVGGGRIGIREWMHFDDQTREKLLDMDFEKWGAEIERMVPNYGQLMKKSASLAFEAGHINKAHYLVLTGSGQGA